MQVYSLQMHNLEFEIKAEPETKEEFVAAINLMCC